MSPPGVSNPSSQPDTAGADRTVQHTGPAPVIELRGVWKRFARLEVLRGIDLAAKADERIYWADADAIAQRLAAHLRACPAASDVPANVQLLS